MFNEIVKLCPNNFTKELLDKASKSKHFIQIDEDGMFFVRDKQTSTLLFRGIKIKDNLWGITFKG